MCIRLFSYKKFVLCVETVLHMLNIDNNGDKDAIVELDICLLIEVSVDLRNVVKTIVGLPEGCAGNCLVVLNHQNLIITARNVMTLLIAMNVGAETAVHASLVLCSSPVASRSLPSGLRSALCV